MEDIVKHAPAWMALSLLLLPWATHADEIRFRNGDRLTGKIVSMEGSKLRIDTALAGEVTVEWQQVATFSSDEPIELRFPDGSIVVGKMAAAEDGQVQLVESAQLAPQTFSLSQTEYVNPPFGEWSGKLIASAALTRGNSHTTGGLLDLQGKRRRARPHHGRCGLPGQS
jgi:hypothetical protein